MALAEGFLQRVQDFIGLRAPGGKAFDGLHLATVRLDREQEARPDRLAVHEHRAGTAGAVLAAEVGAGQAEFLTEQVGEQEAWHHPRLALGAVDGETDRVRGHGAAPARVAARLSAWAPSPAATRRR